MPVSRFCHEGSTCGIQMSRLRQPPAHVSFGWMSGHYSANSVFSAITGVNEASQFYRSLYSFVISTSKDLCYRNLLPGLAFQNILPTLPSGIGGVV